MLNVSNITSWIGFMQTMDAESSGVFTFLIFAIIPIAVFLFTERYGKKQAIILSAVTCFFLANLYSAFGIVAYSAQLIYISIAFLIAGVLYFIMQ